MFPEPRRVATGPGEGYGGVVWLPSGSIVVTVLNDSSEGGSPPSLWSLRPGERSLRPLLDKQLDQCYFTHYRHPTALTDGRVGVVRQCQGFPNPDGSQERDTWALLAYDEQDGSHEVILELDLPHFFVWDPAAEIGLIEKSSGLCAGIALLTADGVQELPVEVGQGEQRFRIDEEIRRPEASECIDWGIATSPAMSPDGSVFSFFASPESVGIGGFTKPDLPFELYRMDAEELHPEVVTSGIYHPSLMAWSPDGSRVAFSADMSEETGAWVVEFATGHTWKVAEDSWLSVAWSPDGTQLLGTVEPSEDALFPEELVLIDLPDEVIRAE